MTDDLYPAYIALIRLELKLPPGSDAVAELASRLAPEDPAQKPSARAPGIVRLRRALRQLEAHKNPDAALDEFATDLRFLSLFSLDVPLLDNVAMERLLADVTEAPKRRQKDSARITDLPIRTKEDA